MCIRKCVLVYIFICIPQSLKYTCSFLPQYANFINFRVFYSSILIKVLIEQMSQVEISIIPLLTNYPLSADNSSWKLIPDSCKIKDISVLVINEFMEPSMLNLAIFLLAINYLVNPSLFFCDS